MTRTQTFFQARRASRDQVEDAKDGQDQSSDEEQDGVEGQNGAEDSEQGSDAGDAEQDRGGSYFEITSKSHRNMSNSKFKLQ